MKVKMENYCFKSESNPGEASFYKYDFCLNLFPNQFVFLEKSFMSLTSYAVADV